MARDDFEDQFSWLPNDWTSAEASLFEDMFGDEFNDRTAQALYHAGYFDKEYDGDQRAAIRENLDSYLMDTYGIDFSDSFDWEKWREAYGVS